MSQIALDNAMRQSKSRLSAPVIFKTRPKVAWGIPLEESVYSQWFTNYLVLKSAVDDVIITTYGSFIDTARNNLVDLFLKSEAEYLFFLDSDTCPPPDAVDRLLAHRKEIVAGWYRVKKNPHHPCVYSYVGWNEEKQWHDYKPFTQAPSDPSAPECVIGCGQRHAAQLEIIDAIGFGCILIHRSIFTDKITGRWFTTEEGGTEDMSFCRRAAKAGILVFVDWSLHCSHLGIGKF